LNVPLLVAEGSTDAAAYRYPQILNEQSFALYEINLYLRILAIAQPRSILQWQLTADYSPLAGAAFSTTTVHCGRRAASGISSSWLRHRALSRR
jgi:hypothetical protein